MRNKGVRVIKGETVERLSSEGPLDQNLGIALDGNEDCPVLIDSIADPDDIFQRCPALGVVDCGQGPAGKSIAKSLEGLGDLAGDIYLYTVNGERKLLQGGQLTDRYSVSDASWMDDPEELAWKSALLAQLQSKHNAVTHYLNDPAVANFAGTMTEIERAAAAGRARELAKQLQEEALGELEQATIEGEEQHRRAVQDTMSRVSKWIVTREDAIKNGGLTETEFNHLFEEVE